MLSEQIPQNQTIEEPKKSLDPVGVSRVVDALPESPGRAIKFKAGIVGTPLNVALSCVTDRKRIAASTHAFHRSENPFLLTIALVPIRAGVMKLASATAQVGTMI